MQKGSPNLINVQTHLGQLNGVTLTCKHEIEKCEHLLPKTEFITIDHAMKDFRYLRKRTEGNSLSD